MRQASDGQSPDVPPARTLLAKTAIGMGWLIAWRMVTRLLGVISTLTLARLLVPGDFGLVAMATALSAMIESLSELGLQDALVRRVGDERTMFDAAFTLQIARAALTAALLAAASPFVGALYGEPRLAPVMLVLAAASLIGGLENVGVAEFRREMRFDVQFRLLMLPRLLAFATTLGYALISRSYWALLAGILVGKVARTVMTYVVHPHRSGLSLRGWRALFGFSFWTWANSVVAMVWDRLETLIVGPVFGVSALGIYTVATEVAILPVTELIAPSTDVLFAAFAVAQKDGTRSIRYAPVVAVALLTAVLPVSVGISAGAAPLVGMLLGPAWSAAAPLTAVLAWMCVFSPVSFIANAALIANGFVHRTFVARVVSAAIKLAVVFAIVSHSSDLRALATAVTICVAIESAAYALLLLGTDELQLRPALTAGARALAGGAVAAAGLLATGVGWRPAATTALGCLGQCVAIGMVAGTLHLLTVGAAWWAAGRPDGPEALLVRALKPKLAKFFRPLRPAKRTGAGP